MSSPQSLPTEDTYSFPGVLHRTGIHGVACTTFAIGGACTAFFDIASVEALRSILSAQLRSLTPYRVLGNGSNIVIPDQGVQDVVLRLSGEFREVSITSTRLRVGGAASVMTLSRNAAESGLAGIEFAAGIPGSMGGAVCMNAGAHGGCFADVIESVEVMLPNGELVQLHSNELDFSYRHSTLPKGAVVLSATLDLVAADSERVKERRKALLAERKATQPLTDPCAGSVFKNPEGRPAAAKLIDQCGLKGSWEGGVCVSPRHANWIVNPGRKGTAAQVRTLVERIQQVVQAQTAVVLQPEIIFW